MPGSLLVLLAMSSCGVPADSAGLAQVRAAALGRVLEAEGGDADATACVAAEAVRSEVGEDGGVCEPSEDDTERLLAAVRALGLPVSAPSACTFAPTPDGLCDSVLVDSQTRAPAALYRAGCPFSDADGRLQIRVERSMCELGVEVYRCTMSRAPGGWQVGACALEPEA